MWCIACPLSVQVCLAAVGLVCDLCRALMANILPYCDEIMQLLLENLGVSNSHFLKHLCAGVSLCNRTSHDIKHLYNVSGVILCDASYFLWKSHLVNCIEGEKRVKHILAALTVKILYI